VNRLIVAFAVSDLSMDNTDRKMRRSIVLLTVQPMDSAKFRT